MNDHARILLASVRLLAVLCLTAGSVLCGTANAQSSSGYQLGGTLNLPFSPVEDSQGNTIGYVYTGGTVGVSVNVPITANVSFSPSTVGNWSQVGNWGFGGFGLAWVDSLLTANAIVNGASAASTLNFGPVASDVTQANQILGNSGPTQKSVSFDLGSISFSPDDEVNGLPISGSGSVSLSTTATLNFNVTIPSGTQPTQVTIDQPTINLLGLYISKNATVYANAGLPGASFVINQTLYNEGTINNLWGTVSGEFSNYGSAYLGAPLTVSGVVSNSGNIVTIAGTSLDATGGVTNYSIIRSTGGTIDVAGTSYNAGSIELTNGGVLTVTGTVTQSSGGQLVGTSGVVNLDNGTISGGSLNFDSSSLLTASGGTLDGVTSNATIIVPGAGGLNVEGNLVDNGTIEVDPAGYGCFAGCIGGPVVDFSGGTVSGSGTIALGGPNGSPDGTISGSLTQAAGHSITGQGGIDATLVNDGTVDANAPYFNGAQQINFHPASGSSTLTLTNNGLMEATNGGTLTFSSGVNLTNSATGTLLADDGVVNIGGGAIVSDGGVIQATNQGKLNIGGVINEGAGLQIEVNDGTLNINGGTINQNGAQLSAADGTVNLNSGTISGGVLNFDSSSLLTASGGTLDGVTSNATIIVPGAGGLNVEGNLVDNGTIEVDPAGYGCSAGCIGGPVVDFSGGTVSGSGTIVLGGPNGSPDGTISGSLTQAAGHSITGQGGIDATLVNDGTVDANAPYFNGAQQINFHPASGSSTLTLTNNGLMEATNGGTLTFSSGVNLTNSATGTLLADGGVVNVSNADLTDLSANVLTAGTYAAENGGTLTLPEDVTTNVANIILSGNGSTISQLSTLARNEGTLDVVGGNNLTTTSSMINSGTVDVGAATSSSNASGLTVSGQYTQTSGSTTVDGTLSAPGGMAIDGGTMAGSGTVVGNVFNSGIVNPGDPTTLTVDGNYTQGPDGTLLMDVSSASDFTMLDVSGSASLSGTAEFDFLDGFVPTQNMSFGFLNASSISGNFNSMRFSGIDCLQCSINFNSTTDSLTLEVSDASAILGNSGSSASTPEPGTLSLFGAGLIGLIWISTRRRRARTDQREAETREPS